MSAAVAEPLQQSDDSASSAKLKAEERERKKAEVRKRLEEAGKAGKKAKKGFLTPERKKKLRKLLMIKAAEDLKQQQKKRESERQNALSSKIPALPDLDNVNDKAQLEKIYTDLFNKMVQLEDEKYEINYVVSQKDGEINEMSISVNDLRGKFVKPTLKKVSKYENRFRKLGVGAGAEKAEGPPAVKKDFRSQLKVVKKENVIDEIVNKKKGGEQEKPEWSKKGKGEAAVPVAPPKRGSVASSVGKASAKEEVAEEPPVEEVPEEVEEEEEEEGEEEE